MKRSQQDLRHFFSGGNNIKKRKNEESESMKSCSKSVSDNKTRHNVYDCEKRKRDYQKSWEKEFPWVELNDEQKMHCTWCTQFPDLADKNSPLFKGAGCSAQGFRKETLQTHGKSKCHLRCQEAKFAKANPTSTPMAVAIRNMNKENFEKLVKLFNTAYFLVTENLAFSKFKDLCKLQIKNGLALGDSYLNRDACKDFITSIATVLRRSVAEEIKQAQFLCIIADGSTDKSSCEQEAVYVRYVNNGSPTTKLAGLIPVKNGNSNGIHKSILDGLNKIGITEDMLAEKLVGLNLDGAATNMGIYNGVQAIMKEKYPYLIVMHCINHNLELSILDTKRNEPYMLIFEKTLKQIFSFYHFSPKRQRELEEVANMLNSHLLKFGGLQNIRWVAIQHRALQSLLNNFDATVLHLEDVAERGSTDESVTARGLLKTIKSNKFKKMLLFLMDFFSVLSEISRAFQDEKFLVIDAYEKLQLCILKLENLKINEGPSQRQFSKLLDAGNSDVPVSKRITTSSAASRPALAHDETGIASSLIDKAVNFLNKRFQPLQADVIKSFAVFNFTEWPDDKSLLLTFGNEQVACLCEHFRHFFPVTVTEIEEEWTDLKFKISNIVKNQPRNSILDVYRNVLLSTNRKSIHMLIELMLTMSSSTAVVERGFSAMNLQKNILRTCMQQHALDDVMQIHINGQQLSEFDPVLAIDHWLNAGPGRRHIH